MALIKDAQNAEPDIISLMKDHPLDRKQANPQEQAAYNRVVLAGMKILYDPATHPGIMAMLHAGQMAPANTVARVVALIIEQMDKISKNTIPTEVVLPASSELLMDVGQLAEKAGIFQFPVPVAFKAMQALVVALAQYFGVSLQAIQGLVNQANPDALKKLVPALQKLDGVTPGFNQPVLH